MNTLAEIEAAALALPVQEQSELVAKLIVSIRGSGNYLAEPRTFSMAEMQDWLAEDERQGREIREMLARDKA